MSILDLQNEFYRPLWIRVGLLIILFAWAVLEFYAGAPIWGIVFGSIGVAGLWQWFFASWPKQPLTNEKSNMESESRRSESGGSESTEPGSRELESKGLESKELESKER